MRPRFSLRTVVVLGALAGAVSLGLLATVGLGQGSVYYYTPAEVAAGKGRGEVVRVGGEVARGSVRWDPEAGVLRFLLSDGRASLAVANRGAPPDLFREGRDALAEGRLSAGVLRTSNVIVKHDEDYEDPRRKAER